MSTRYFQIRPVIGSFGIQYRIYERNKVMGFLSDSWVYEVVAARAKKGEQRSTHVHLHFDTVDIALEAAKFSFGNEIIIEDWSPES